MPLLASNDIEIDIVPNSGPYANLNNITPGATVAKIIDLLLGAAGVVAFIYLLWGGIAWITSGGDKEGLDRARKKITSALVGLAIVFSSYAMLYIVRAVFGIKDISVTLNRIGP